MKFPFLKFTRRVPATAFGHVVEGQRGFCLQGTVDWRAQTRIYGWVWDASKPSERLCVVARTADREIASAVADVFRSDLESAWIGDGCHAFVLQFERCDIDLISVEVAGTGFAIPVAPYAVADATSIQEGTDGWLFLRLGTNYVERFFTEENYFSASDIERWCAIMAGRESRASALGAKYFHFIVPDKITVYFDRYIGSLPHYDKRPSRVLPLALQDTGLSHVYIDIAPALIAERNSALLYYKTDTHWTPFGALLAYQKICRALDIEEANLSEIEYKEFLGTLDLGGQLDRPIQEMCGYLEFSDPPRRLFANELVTYFEDKNVYNPMRGRHIIYRNERLNGARKLVIFGDSFCATGVYSFLKLLTRIFYDVHFFWSTSVDFGYIEEVRPDFIITEIAERFVKRFPDDQLDLRAFASERCAAFMQSCPSLSALITDDVG